MEAYKKTLSYISYLNPIIIFTILLLLLATNTIKHVLMAHLQQHTKKDLMKQPYEPVCVL